MTWTNGLTVRNGVTKDGNNFWCILVVKMVESSERHPGQKLVVHLVSFENFENKEIHVVMS